MSQRVQPVDLEAVRNEERVAIEHRRREAGLPQRGNARTDLVGVAFSGGGLRCSSFCLGIAQYFYKTGLWRYVDYLSTVSGGGYIGAYLSSYVMKHQRRLARDSWPIVNQDRQPQTPESRRFISSGYFLLRPWELVNKYLIGLFFLNLALFSGAITLCLLVALLWRALDYTPVRDRLALLELRTDAVVPFIPFVLFGVTWLAAWIVSYWRKGAEAPGAIARRLLFLTLASLLIAVTMLLGNGDISFRVADTLADTHNPAAPSGLIASLIGLVFGGLLPFLNPRRLVESGLKPDKKPWERVVFHSASTALLVGMPLVLIGFFGRENISGYNDHPHRPLVKEDIETWRSVPHLFGGHGSVSESEMLAAEGQSQKIVGVVRMLVRGDVGTTGSASDSDQRLQLENAQRYLFDLDEETGHERTDSGHALRQKIYERADRYFVNPQQAADGGGLQSAEDRFVHQAALAVALDCAMEMHDRYDRMLRAQDEWQIVPVRQWLKRAYWIAGWKLAAQESISYKSYMPGARLRGDAMAIPPHENIVATYWRAKVRTEQLQDAVCLVINRQWLPNRSLLERQVAAWGGPPTKKQEDQRRADKPSETDSRPAVAVPAVASNQAETRRLLRLAQLSSVARWETHECAQLNRLLLQEAFPEIFRDRAQVRRRVSIVNDQKTRFAYLGAALAVFLLAGVWVDLNATSMHRYYRNRLQSLFIVPQDAKTPACALSRMCTTQFGAPYHLLSASVGGFNYLRSRTRTDSFDPAVSQRENLEKRITPFLFSQLYCGSESTGYLATEKYESYVRGDRNQIDLAEAVALSGAAMSSEHVHNWLVVFLMVVFNLRLGQWIPNPGAAPPRVRPRVLYLLGSLAKSLFWRDDPSNRQYCFATDGGFSDNLGLLQLLDRRCRLIVVIDGSCDYDNRFDDLANALRLARVDRGIRLLEIESDEDWTAREFPGASDKLADRSEDNGSKSETRYQHFSLARIVYSPPADPAAAPAEGLLIYLKPSLTGDENLDLMQYRQRNPGFPHESTSDQVFDEAQVESYRQLGYHIAERLLKLLPPIRDGRDLWSDPTAADVNADQLCGWWRNARLVTQQYAGVNTSVEVADVRISTTPADSATALPEAARPAAEMVPDPAERGALAPPADEEIGLLESPHDEPLPSDSTPTDEIHFVEAFSAPVLNCVTRSEIIATELVGTAAPVEVADDITLHELLANEATLEATLRQNEAGKSLILTALRMHPSPGVRLMIVDKLSEVPGLAKEIRSLLKSVAQADPHSLVRKRARQVVSRRQRPR